MENLLKHLWDNLMLVSGEEKSDMFQWWSCEWSAGSLSLVSIGSSMVFNDRANPLEAWALPWDYRLELSILAQGPAAKTICLKTQLYYAWTSNTFRMIAEFFHFKCHGQNIVDVPNFLEGCHQCHQTWLNIHPIEESHSHITDVPKLPSGKLT